MTSFMGDPRFSQEAQLKRLAEDIDATDREPHEPVEDHEAHAAGKLCAHCERELGADDEVRKTVTGEWVHDNCPS